MHEPRLKNSEATSVHNIEAASVLDTDAILRKLGFEIHPKKELTIPDIDMEQLEADYPDYNFAWGVANLLKFLNGKPVSDDLGNKHGARRESTDLLYANLISEYGQEHADQLKQIYYDNNQLKRNILGNPVSFLSFLISDFSNIKETKIASDLKAIMSEIEVRIYGGKDPEDPSRVYPDYNTISDVSEKLDIVQFVEDKVIEALNIISSWQKSK